MKKMLHIVLNAPLPSPPPPYPTPCTLSLQKQSLYIYQSPLWGTMDAEIKVVTAGNTELLKGLTFKKQQPGGVF